MGGAWLMFAWSWTGILNISCKVLILTMLFARGVSQKNPGFRSLSLRSIPRHSQWQGQVAKRFWDADSRFLSGKLERNIDWKYIRKLILWKDPIFNADKSAKEPYSCLFLILKILKNYKIYCFPLIVGKDHIHPRLRVTKDIFS